MENTSGHHRVGTKAGETVQTFESRSTGIGWGRRRWVRLIMKGADAF